MKEIQGQHLVGGNNYCVATFSLWQQCVVYLQQRLSPPHQECRHEMSAGEPNKKVESFKTDYETHKQSVDPENTNP